MHHFEWTEYMIQPVRYTMFAYCNSVNIFSGDHSFSWVKIRWKQKNLIDSDKIAN